jgi:hypothetical protein
MSELALRPIHANTAFTGPAPAKPLKRKGTMQICIKAMQFPQLHISASVCIYGEGVGNHAEG